METRLAGPGDAVRPPHRLNVCTRSVDLSDSGTIVFEFGSPDFDIDSVLGPRTRRIVNSATNGETFIISKRSHGPLSDATILATGTPLTAKNLDLIRAAANEPRAFYNGNPIFQRLPSGQDFAIQLRAGDDTLDLMIDLLNPSWGFYCDSESYQAWHWVGQYFKDIAKASFPEFASPSAKHMWRTGVISQLKSNPKTT